MMPEHEQIRGPCPRAPRARIGTGVALAAVLLGVGCGGEQAADASPATRTAATDVARADSLYHPAVFDTVRWNRWVDRSDRGRVVYYYSCAKCHGPEGEGGGSRARGRELDVPSIVDPGWRYDGRIDSIRRVVFVGHRSEMPSWGVTTLTLRDMDAVAHYVDELLPEERVEEPPSREGP